MTDATLRAYSCTVVGTDWNTTVHALSAAKAKYLYWLNVTDAWPDVPYTSVRVRVLGLPRTSDKFCRTAKYRNAWFTIGDKVRVGESIGFVADSDDSANFVVHCISGEWAGRAIHVHFSDIRPFETEGATPCNPA